MNKQRLINIVQMVALIVLLAALIAGGGLPGLRRAHAATTYKVSITAASLSIRQPSDAWFNSGHWVYGNTVGFAPLPVPVGASITSVTWYAFENGADNICVSLYLAKPSDGVTNIYLGGNCTANSATDPQVVPFAATTNTVTTGKAPYLQVSITGNAFATRFYGAKITYSVP